MRILDRIGLVVFSVIVFILSFILCLMIFGWVDVDILTNSVEVLIENSILGNIAICISILFILLSIKCIFFNSETKENMKSKDGILLENDNGKLLVSRDTIENLTNTVVKSFESAESVMTKVEVDGEMNIRIYITLFVYPDAIIKELTSKLQNDVKVAIKKSLDLEVKEVNVRVKNISPKKEQIIKE